MKALAPAAEPGHRCAVVARGKDDELDVGPLGAKRDDQVKSIDPRHPEVHQYEPRLAPFHERQQLRRVLRLADNLDVGLALEHPADPLQEQRVVIGDQHLELFTSRRLIELCVELRSGIHLASAFDANRHADYPPQRW